MKKIREDKQTGVVIHTHMEIPQRNFLCNYLYLKLKCHVFHFIFSFFLLQSQRTGGWNKFCPGGMVGTCRRGDVGKKG
jgi:hypothetical protein